MPVKYHILYPGHDKLSLCGRISYRIDPMFYPYRMAEFMHHGNRSYILDI